MLEKAAIILMTASILAMAATRLVGPSEIEYPAIGDVSPEIRLVATEGGVEPIGIIQGRLLISFFSTTCEWCLASLDTYASMVASDCTLSLAVAVLDKEGEALSKWWEEEPGKALVSAGQQGCGGLLIGSAERPIPLELNRTPTHYYIVDNVIDTVVVGGLMEVPSWVR